MFATVTLAERLDRAEARLSASLGDAVAASSPDADPFVEHIGGGVAVYAGPSSPMNKMIGIGFDGVPADDTLQLVEDQFSRRQAPLQAEISTLADPAVAALLTRRGYVLEGFENVLGRPVAVDNAGFTVDGIDIQEMNGDEAAIWLDTAVTGFLHLDQQGVQPAPLPPRDDLEASLRDITNVPGFIRYFARIDADIAGVATLRVDAGVAQLCGAATLPRFRRRGVQKALLRRRLADAARAGCDVAVMTTQPGSKSQENGHRQGFSLLYSRALLVKGACT
jgi:GNAT superfamily N-acetyltransferase